MKMVLLWYGRMEKTIREVAEEYGLSRFTLQQVAAKGRFPARQSGNVWLINTKTEQFVAWLEAHQYQPRVKGRKK